jgi:legumain
VFVNFVDHGAPGLLAFPSDELYADDLIKALKKMAVNRQFAQVRRAEIIMAKSSSAFINQYFGVNKVYFSAKVCHGEWNFVCYSLVELMIYVCYYKALLYLFRHLAHILRFVEL